MEQVDNVAPTVNGLQVDLEDPNKQINKNKRNKAASLTIMFFFLGNQNLWVQKKIRSNETCPKAKGHMTKIDETTATS